MTTLTELDAAFATLGEIRRLTAPRIRICLTAMHTIPDAADREPFGWIFASVYNGDEILSLDLGNCADSENVYKYAYGIRDKLANFVRLIKLVGGEAVFDEGEAKGHVTPIACDEDGIAAYDYIGNLMFTARRGR